MSAEEGSNYFPADIKMAKEGQLIESFGKNYLPRRRSFLARVEGGVSYLWITYGWTLEVADGHS